MGTPNYEVGKYAGDAQLAAAMRDGMDGIVRTWSEAVTRGDQVKAEQVGEVLGGEPAGVLESMAGMLEQGPQGPGPQAVKPEQADHKAIEPRQMIWAYGVLRPVVLEQVGKQLGRVLKTEEAIALCGAMDCEAARRVGEAMDRSIGDYRAQAEAQAKYMSFLSHDLRGSLNGVVLMLEVLRRELKDRPEFEESLTDLNIMRKSILDTVGVMDRHLYADRLRRGRIAAQIQDVAMRVVVNEVAGELAEAARAKGSEMVVEVPAEAVVKADPKLLGAALRELLDNAIKYGVRGEIRVEAEAQVEGGQRVWVLAVSDSGPGMEPERLAKLIDPIQRLELRERGLGLSIVYSAGRLMGAWLEAESKPGMGSQFRIHCKAI